jgi:NitT/TauT family transport system ATP-binding protein
MKQRIALIRTLAIAANTILLDEPFSSLDFELKIKAQRLLVEQQRQFDSTVVLVTHDIEDALALADKIVILSKKPARVKREFIGTPSVGMRDPILARSSPDFHRRFAEIWEQLRDSEVV